MDPILLLGGALVAVIFVLAAARTIVRGRADVDAWDTTLRTLGGDFTSPRPGALRGHVGDYPVWVDPWGSKKAMSADITPYVEYKAWLDLPDRSLQVCPRIRFDESLPALLGHKVTTGDSAFDDTFRVRAGDVDAALAFLTPQRRAALLRVHEEFPKAFLEFERLTLRVKGARQAPEAMVATIRRLGSLAGDVAPPGIK